MLGGSIEEIRSTNCFVPSPPISPFSRSWNCWRLFHALAGPGEVRSFVSTGHRARSVWTDCLGMTTPQRAMQCCSAMRCRRPGRRNQSSQDCCTTSSRMHAELGQPSSAQGVPFFRVSLGVVQLFIHSQIRECFSNVILRHSHDPPPLDPALVTPLRI
jgi:hypothetical protein